MNILFLCTGNSCRSVISEATFNHLAPGLTLFVRYRRGAGELNEVMLYDKRDPAKDNDLPDALLRWRKHSWAVGDRGEVSQQLAAIAEASRSRPDKQIPVSLRSVYHRTSLTWYLCCSKYSRSIHPSKSWDRPGALRYG